MEYIGGVCPDQLVHIPTTDNKNHCKNVYNMTVNDDNQCYEGKIEKTKIFPEIKGWPPAGDALKARCDWKKKCGTKKGIDAIWSGLNCY